MDARTFAHDDKRCPIRRVDIGAIGFTQRTRGAAYPAPESTPRQCFDHKADLFLHNLRIGLNIKF